MISLLSTITFSTNWTQILILESRNPKVIFYQKKQTKIGKDGQKSLNHLKTITIIMNCCKSPSNAAIWVSN